MDKQDEGLMLLKNIRHITHQIETIQEQITLLRTKLTSTTIKPKDVDVQSSGSKDPMADQIIKVVEYEQALESYQYNLCEMKSTVISVLQMMTIREQELLTIRYIQGNTIEETAEILGRSYYGTWKRLNKAEENFVKLFSEVDSN